MNIFRWQQHKDEEPDAEIRSHLDDAIRDRMERGETAAQAQANALREFGNVGLIKEVTRAMWGGARTFTAKLALWVVVIFGRS